MLAMEMVKTIRDALCETDPLHAKQYRQNAASLLDELGELEEQFRRIVADAPRKEVLFGSRFSVYYFAREYGLCADRHAALQALSRGGVLRGCAGRDLLSGGTWSFLCYQHSGGCKCCHGEFGRLLLVLSFGGVAATIFKKNRLQLMWQIDMIQIFCKSGDKIKRIPCQLIGKKV